MQRAIKNINIHYTLAPIVRLETWDKLQQQDRALNCLTNNQPNDCTTYQALKQYRHNLRIDP